MKPGHVFAATAALLLLGNAPPTPIEPTAAELANFGSGRNGYRSYPSQPITGWESALRQALGAGSLDAAAAELGPQYGLTGADMRALARLWIVTAARQYDRQRSEAESEAIRAELLALLRRTHRPRLVLQAVAESVDRLADCREQDFNALMAGATDRAADAWTIANGATCGPNFMRAAAAAPDRSMPALIRLANYGSLGAKDALPLLQWLTTPAAFARIAPSDRPALSAWLYAEEITLLFRTGLTAQAVARIESLPADLRDTVLTRRAGTITAMVDGLPIAIVVDQPSESLKFQLAAAYALAGRTAEAEALFASLTDLPAARQAFDCAQRFDGGRPAPDCASRRYGSRDVSRDILLLDHFLHHPDDDPYPLTEYSLGHFRTESDDNPVELRCRVFAEPQYAGWCDGAKRMRLFAIGQESGRLDPDGGRVSSGLDALRLPGFAEAKAATAAAFARIVAASPPLAPLERRTRASVAPAASPFAERPLPAAFRGPRPSPPERIDAPALPRGFTPVRIESDGRRTVAISLSQTYDPTGEASPGGYWVHVARGRGRHWDPPLYTGLADHFPYVVAPTSRLPLLDGDTLDLEIEVAEVDTASISYPPVAMRSSRQATGLYLRIPLADLARDSDGDGITDIAAHSLLLDRARSGGGTPFVVGSDAGRQCPAASPERAAQIALLQRLFTVGDEAAVVEPVDRPQGEPMSLRWRRASAAVDRPVFIQGDPRDYRCLRPGRLVIVYAESDIAALERFRPDFHAVTITPIVYNRAHDRGYVSWSARWRGGTLRLRLVNGAWVFEEVSSWIT